MFKKESTLVSPVQAYKRDLRGKAGFILKDLLEAG